MRGVLMGLMALLLAACSAPDGGAGIPAQKWNDTVIQVESRPEPVEAGMNEFLVLATLERGRPVHDLVVSLRAGDAQPWQQAIQDGFSGVYRKAIEVPPGAQLQVQLRQKLTKNETVLTFPLFPPQAAPAAH